METVDDVLAHFGVPGMKWGVRRARSSSSSSATPSEDYVRAVTARSKPAHALSNQEMRALIDRMDLEKRYVSALSTPVAKTKGSAAKKFVTNLLLDVGRTEVTRVVRTAAAIQVENKLLGTKVSGKDFSKSLGKRLQPKQKDKKD